jgi:predicted lipoprotein with Yx(FWY)xxD motif
VTGFWQDPIDGVWTDELTAALQEFQIALGVEPTGVVDTATLAAFEQALAEQRAAPPSTGTSPTPTTAASTASAATAAATTPVTITGPAAAGEVTVLVGDSDLGQVLTAADGKTVYLFVPDAQGAPTCTGSCVQTWPPLIVDDRSEVTAGEGVDASLLGTVEHPAAGTQVTYNRWPLYHFAGDSAPGDTSGQGQGGVWYVIDPTGNAIDSD